MMRHLGWIVVLAFLCSLTGCDCEGVQPKPDCDCEPSITFLSPTSGSLTDFQDSNRNPSDGIQYPVRVQTRCIPPGTTLKLTRGSTELTAEVVADVGVTGRANFGDLSFTAGANHICVASGAILITTDEDGGQDCQPRSVSQVEACKDVEVSVGVPACRFEDPEDGITLTAADDSAADQPGFQHDVTILCTGITAGSELRLTAGSAPPRSAPLISLALPLTKATFTDVGLTEGANLLAAFVPDAAVRTEIEVTVNTGSCAVRLQPPDGTTFNLADDVDLDTPRLQVAFTATTDTDGPFACQDHSTVVVHLGEETHTGILEAGQLRIVATLTESGKLPAYVEVVEPGGRRGRSLDHTYQVSLALQTCTFDDPVPGAVLAGSADSSAAIGFQHDVAVTCRGVNAGRFLNLTVGNNPAVALALETVDASSVRAVFKDVSFSQGRNLLVAETIGQDGMPVRADAVITVDTGECAVRLLPPDGSVFSIADDIDPATPRLQVQFTVETDSEGAFECQDGSAVSLHLGDALLTGTLAGSVARITATLEEAGTLEAYAEVVESGGRQGRSLTNTYQVDLATQACWFEDPPDGTTLTGSEDSSSNVGFQHPVSVVCRGVNAGETLRLTVNQAQPIERPLTAIDYFTTRATFDEVSFNQGPNALLAETLGQDGLPVTVSALVFVDTGECRVRLLPPDGTNFTIADDIDPATPRLQVQFTVETDPEGAFACEDGSAVTFHLGDTVLYSSFAGSQAQFVAMLPESGVLLGYAEAIETGGRRGRSLDQTYHVSLVEQTCWFEDPADGATLTGAEDSSTAVGFQHNVRVLCRGVAAGQRLRLTVDLAQPVERLFQAVDETTVEAVFDDVSLQQGSNHLRAETIGLDGLPVEANADVLVDTGLCAVYLQPPDGTAFSLADDDAPGTPQLQVRFTVSTDAEGAFACQDGSAVSLHVGEATGSGVLQGGKAEIVLTLSTAGVAIGYAEVQESGGRSGRSLDLTYQVILEAQACWFENPVDGATLTGADDSSPAMGFQQDIAIACQGVSAGQLLTLTVNGNLTTGILAAGDGGLVRLSFANVELAEGQNHLEAETTGKDGMQVTATADVTVETGVCTVRLLPPDGTVLSLSDDVEPATPRLQAQFTVATDTSGAFACQDGSAVTLHIGDQVLTGTLSGGEARLVATLTMPGAITGFAEVVELGGRSGRSPDQTYEVNLVLQRCSFEDPVDGSSLTADDDSSQVTGFQHDVKITCQGVSAGEVLRLTVNSAAPLEGTLSSVDATTTQIVFTDVELDQGENTLEAAATGQDGAPVTAAIGVTVDTGLCAVRLLPPDATMFRLANDADPSTEGLQVIFTVQTDASGAFACEDGSDVTLTIGAVQFAGTFEGDQASIMATLAVDGALAGFAEVVEAGGRTGRSATQTYYVCTTPLSAAFVPAWEGQTLYDAADQDPLAPGIQIAVTGMSSGVMTAGDLQLACTGTGGEACDVPAQPSPFFPNNEFTFSPVSFLESGVYTLQVTGRNACGDQVQSRLETLRVISGQLVCWVEDPAEGAVLNAQNDAEQGQNGLQYAVVVNTSAPVPNGHPFTLSVNGQEATSGTIVSHAWTGTLTLPEGSAVTLQCDIQNGIAQPVRTIAVDSVPPTVAIGSPADGAELEATEISVCVTASGLEPADPPNWEPRVTITVADAGGQSDEFTCTLDDDGTGCCAVGLYNGANTITAVVHDRAQNTGSASIAVQNYIFGDLPAVAFLDPVDAQNPAIGAYDVQVEVLRVVPVGFADHIVLRQSRDGIVLDEWAPVSYASNVAHFAAVLRPGLIQLEACASNASGTTCDRVDIVVGPPDLPTLSIVAPAEGTCTQASAIAASAETTHASGRTCHFCREPAPFSVTVACAPTSPSFVSSGAVAVDGTCVPAGNIPLPAESSYVIWASVQNDIGTDTDETTITRDNTGPTLAFLAPGAGVRFGAGDDASGQAGFQLEVELQSNLPDGATLSYLRLDGVAANTNGETPVFSSGRITFNAVDAGDGAHTLSAQACDACNNCQTASVSFTVDLVVPDGDIVDPTAGELLGQGDDKLLDPGFQYWVRVNLRNAAVGDVVCLERNFGFGWIATGSGNCHTLTAGQLATYLFQGVNQATLLEPGISTASLSLRVTLNDGVNSNTTPTVAISVNLLMPEVNITRPAEGVTFNGSTDNDFTTPGYQSWVGVASTNTVYGDPIGFCLCKAGDTCLDAGSADLCLQKGYGSVLWAGTVESPQMSIYGLTFGEGLNTVRAFTSNPNLAFSAPVSFTVETVPPTVVSWTSSDANGNGCLTAAEGNLVLQVQVIDPDGHSLNNQILRLRQGDLNGTQKATGTITSNQATITYTLPENADPQQFTLTFTDLAGNPNIRLVSPVINDPEATLWFRADRQIPTIAFSSPLETELNAADDVDPVAPGFQHDVCATTVGVENGQQVTFSLDSTPQAPAVPVAGGTACLRLTIGQGAHTLGAAVSDACGNPAAPASLGVTVDSIVPTISCSAPTTGDYNVQEIPFTCTTTDTDTGGTIRVVSSLGDQCSHVVSASGAVNFTCNFSVGLHNLSVTVTDTAQNTSSAFAIDGVNVDITGCPIAFNTWSGDVFFNKSHDKDGVPGNGLQIDLSACSTGPSGCNSTSCPECRAQLLINGIPTGSALPLSAGGCVTFANTAFADNEQGVIVEVQLDDNGADPGGNVLSDNFQVLLVDLVPPTISRTAPGGASVQCVAATDNPNVNGTTILADRNGATLDQCEINFTFNVTEDKASAEFPVSVVLSNDTVPIGSAQATASPVSVPFADRQLAHGVTHPNIKAVATDAAGNTSSTVTTSVLVDVQAPAQVTISDSTLTNSRRANISMGWSPSGDDGMTGSVTNYRLRWSLNPIDNSNWASATLLYSGTATSQVVTINPLQIYHLAVRAQDDVGNLGPVSVEAVVSNMWNEQATTVVNADKYGFNAWNLGNIDNDAASRDDLAIAANTYNGNNGAIYIYYGAANLSTWATLPSPLTAGGTGETFGADLSAGNFADTPDNPPNLYPHYRDLAVGAWNYGPPLYTAGRGRVLLYFGQNGPLPTTPSVEIRGPAGTNPYFGRSVEVIGDINGDKVEDLFISAPQADTYGHGYIFFGRSEQAWLDLATASGGFVPASAAEINFIYYDAEATVNEWFGFRQGATSLGDLDGDGYGDFLLVASAVNRIYTFDGAAITALAASPPVTLAAQTDALNEITDSMNLDTTSGNRAGFGAMSVGGWEFTGDSMLDLVVSDPFNNRVFLYDGRNTGGDPPIRIGTAPVATLTGSLNFGFSLDSIDVNGDGRRDLVVGCNSGGNCKNVYLYFNEGSSPYFQTANRSTIFKNVGQFGLGVAAGDFNGDGQPDIVVTEYTNKTFYVYY